jgi:hypothetical protein
LGRVFEMARISQSLLLAAAALAGTFAAPTDEACRCQDTWDDDYGDCAAAPIQQRGCPTLAELQRCNTTAADGTTMVSSRMIRTCKTTQPSCADQTRVAGHLPVFQYCEIEDAYQRSVLKSVRDGDATSKCRTAVPPINVNDSVKIYDLTPLQKQPLPDSSVNQANWVSNKQGKAGHNDRSYFMNICAPLVNYAQNDGGNVLETIYGSEDVTDEAAGTHTLGKFANTSLSSVHAGDLRMIMPGGVGSTHETEACPQRQTLIIFFCDEPSRDGDRLGKPYFVDEFNTCEYVFVWNSCAACPLGHPSRETNCNAGAEWVETAPASGFFGGGMDTMSPGSALLITLLICVGLYLLVGTAYNRLILGERGVNQLPNYNFWAGACGSIAAAPGYLYGVVAGRPKMNTYSDQSRFAGLIDDSDDDEVDADAENHEYE